MGEPISMDRFVLRQLPFVSRLVLAVFLVSVGAGYFSALVQLHVQHASPGQLLPGEDEVKKAYGSKAGTGQLERLITADESRPFNGNGQMRAAFFAKGNGWQREVRELAKEKNVSEGEAEKEVRKARSIEPAVIVAWIHAGAGKDSYSGFRFVVPPPLAERLDQARHAAATTRLVGHLERVITADEALPFNGSGQMRAAFFSKASGWKREVRELAKELKVPEPEAEKELRKRRSVEPDTLLAWIRAGASKETYDEFKFVLPPQLARRLTDDAPADYFKKDDQGRWTANIKELIDVRCVRCHATGARGAVGQIQLDEYEKVVDYLPPENSGIGIKPAFFQKQANGQWTANIEAIVDTRCARCHAPGLPGPEGHIHLHNYEHVMHYVHPEVGGHSESSGMSLMKLAQTTHVHLLGFAMLYGLTGMIFAFTSYPGVVRFIVAPLPLAAQIGEISCWWMARADPVFALGIMGLGGLVALGLAAQIVLGLLNLFDNKGKVVVVLLLLATAAAVGVLHQKVIEPHLQSERTAAGRSH